MNKNKNLLIASASIVALSLATPATAAQNCTCPSQANATASGEEEAGNQPGGPDYRAGGYGELHAETGNKPSRAQVTQKRDEDEYTKQDMADAYQAMIDNQQEMGTTENAAENNNGQTGSIKETKSRWNRIGTAQKTASRAGPVPGFDGQDSGKLISEGDTSRYTAKGTEYGKDRTNEIAETNGNESWDQVQPLEAKPEVGGYAEGFDPKAKSESTRQSRAGQQEDRQQMTNRVRHGERMVRKAVRTARMVLPGVQFSGWRVDPEEEGTTLEIIGYEPESKREFRVDVMKSGKVEEIEQRIRLTDVPNNIRQTVAEAVKWYAGE